MNCVGSNEDILGRSLPRAELAKDIGSNVIQHTTVTFKPTYRVLTGCNGHLSRDILVQKMKPTQRQT